MQHHTEPDTQLRSDSTSQIHNYCCLLPEPVANKRHGHPAGQNQVLRRYSCNNSQSANTLPGDWSLTVPCLLCLLCSRATVPGQKLLDSLAETWDFFFCDVLSMLQAIFHPVQVHNHMKRCLFYAFAAQGLDFKQFSLFPGVSCVQGKEPSVRQLALLHFRNTIVLSVKLEDALCRPRARIPPSVTQMLLILQVGWLILNFIYIFQLVLILNLVSCWYWFPGGP